MRIKKSNKSVLLFTFFLLLLATFFLKPSISNADSTQGNVIGQVTNVDGSPIKNARISISYGPGAYFETYTDLEGNYSLSVLNGTWVINAYAANYIPDGQQVSIVSNQITTVNFILQNPGKISGIVTDINGNPIKGAIVFIDSNQAGTSSDGSYTLSGINHGTFTVKVSRDGYVSSSATNVLVNYGSTTRLDFQLTQCGKITIKVTDSDGTPIYPATVNGAYTNSNGVHTFDNLPPSDGYSINVQAKGFVSTKKDNIKVTAGNETTVTIVIQNYIPVTKYKLDPFYGVTSQGKHFIKGFTVSLHATSSSGGIKHTFYRINNGEWQEYTGSFTILASDTHSVQYYSVDNDGNSEQMLNTMNFDVGAFVGTGSYVYIS